MRILANFAKKISTGEYENETYTVTFEAESEFNNVQEVANWLFYQARQAVETQIKQKELKEPKRPESTLDKKQDTVYLLTEAQRTMLFKLVKQLLEFEDDTAKRYILQEANKIIKESNDDKFKKVEHINEIPRKVAGKLLDKLLEKVKEMTI